MTMQNYKVEYTTQGICAAVHVSATSREAALYAAYDELSDKGFTVTALGDVWMFDEHAEQWVKTYTHREVSALVK